MASARHTFEHHGHAILPNDNHGRDPGNPVVSEALRVIFMANLGEAVDVYRNDDLSGVVAGRTGSRGEQVDARRQVVPGRANRTGPPGPSGECCRDCHREKNYDYDCQPNTNIGHSIGTAAPSPIEFPLRTP